MIKKKRCTQVVMTNEAKVLKELRVQKGLSMFQAGQLINKSDSYISHIENGRMDIPKKEQILIILSIYSTSFEVYQDLVANYKEKLSRKEALIQMVAKLDDNKTNKVLRIIEQLLEKGHISNEVIL